jgi:chitin synthase
MYHQIKKVIGVDPSFYEYLFMVDADTTGDPLSVNRLISAYFYFSWPFTIYLSNILGSMIHDKKLLGVCGETELANEQSLITVMQVSAFLKFYFNWHVFG